MIAAHALLICFLLSIVLYQIVLKKKKYEKYRQVEKYPGPMKFPFVGNMWFFAKYEDRLENLMRLQSLYGNRVYLTGGGKRGLLLFHPDDVGKILASREMNKSSIYKYVFKDWMGASLFYAKGKEHSRKRKMVLPAFDVKRVDNFEENLNKNAKILVKILKDNEVGGQFTEIEQLLRHCSLNMALQYIVGKETRSLDNYDGEYAAATHNETKYVSHRFLSPWLWVKTFWNFSTTGRKEKLSRKCLHDTMDKIVQEAKAKSFAQQTATSTGSMGSNGELEEKEKSKLLDHLIRKQQEKEPGVTDQYIRNEANFVLFAAHDTVTSALTLAVYLLASHPEAQAEVHQELENVLGAKREVNIGICDLGKLKHLECCIKETLRLYPSAPIMSRSPAEDFKLDTDLTIPKGVLIGLSPWVTHRLAEFFPEPEKFMPSRFYPENSIGRHPYCYVPFSGGHRNCLGQKIAMDKMKTILAHIFHNFTVELAPGAEKIKPLGDLVLSLKTGLFIKLTSR